MPSPVKAEILPMLPPVHPADHAPPSTVPTGVPTAPPASRSVIAPAPELAPTDTVTLTAGTKHPETGADVEVATAFPERDRRGRPAGRPGPAGARTAITSPIPTTGYGDEGAALGLTVGAAFVTGAIEVEADRLRDSHGLSPTFGPGMTNPYYAAQVNDTKGAYWGTYLGVVPLTASVTGSALSVIGRNALAGAPAFTGLAAALSPIRHVANVLGHAALEDGLYWRGMGKAPDLAWLHPIVGDDLGRVLSTPVGGTGLPQGYFMGAGAFAAPFLGQYRADNAGRQNGFGWGGRNAFMDTLDAIVRGSDAAGAMLTGVSGLTGQTLGRPLQTAMGINTGNSTLNGLAFADRLWRQEDYWGAGAAFVLTALNTVGQGSAAAAPGQTLSGTARTLSLTGAAASLTLGIWQYLEGEK
jgi:hypothetical protein